MSVTVIILHADRQGADISVTVRLCVCFVCVRVCTARIQTLGTPTPHPWYQVHTMKTFNKRNQMHKYGVVYLNRGNDLHVAKYMSRMLPISSPTSL